MSDRRITVLLSINLFLARADGYFERMPLSLAQPKIYHRDDSYTWFGASAFQASENRTGVVGRQTPECDPGLIMCPDELHCTEPGYFCCPENNAYGCAEGNTCCEAGGCAPPGYSCCIGRKGSCPDGSGCCPPPSTSCVPAGGSCCGSGACDSGQSCCEGGGCAAEGYICCRNNWQCPSDTECCRDEDGDPYCAEECVPSLIFPYSKGFLDEIYENMCKGTAASSTTDDPQTAILTLDPNTGDALKRAKATRRRAALCTGSGKLQCAKGGSCDEFPFASSLEGGSGAQIGCVPRWQNDWQGTYYNSWLSEQLKEGKLVRGGKYRVRLKGIDCSQVSKRDLPSNDTSGQILSNDGDVTTLSSSAFGKYSTGSDALFIDLTENEDTPGTYTLNMTVSDGTVISGAIIDDCGEPLANMSSISTGSASSLAVDLGEDYGDITFLGWTQDANVQVQYYVSTPPPSIAASTTSPSSTVSGWNASSKGSRNRVGLLGIVAPLMYFIR